jgi:UDP-N-acetylmuramoyl-tripeptide--D-alanyl-D-alanine ligase
VAVALELGMTLARAGELLGRATAVSRGRMAVTTRPDGVVVVNDAYNSNPDSVRAALHALAAMRRPGAGTWAVLGEMLELGEAAAAEHTAVGELAARLGIDHLVAVGEGARPALAAVAHAGSGTEPAWAPDAESGLALLRDGVAPGDVVLVKASRAIGLDRLAEALLAGTGQRADGTAPAAASDPDGVASSDSPPQPVQDGPVAGAGAARGASGEVSR